ncbi:hypothetical protein ACI2UK_27020 [Ralstonia nicotianae]|uniref:hypothetical protein n=1 Tax=Ralstonia pseudosolanacearum TaxID=1310165 RepID=UPI0020069A1A|nr:hypothetical protein [Ralstonia pseudosolanacearum]MCK4120399.1 hypothetical protein [Ralstonia pseudosolanacearum]
MRKYAKLDEAIMNKMGGHAQAFSEVFVRDVREECERIAKEESAGQKREIESFRVLDRRLQALRKAGTIWHNGKGWLRERSAQS